MIWPTLLAAALLPVAAQAQDAHRGHGTAPPVEQSPVPAPAPPATPAPTPPATGHEQHAPAAPSPGTAAMSHDMAGMDHAMPAMLGPYAMTREASGTSWQPDSTPMPGLMFMAGGWHLMAQANVWGVYSDQGGPRGDDKLFSQSMAMLMASRDAGPGRLGLRAMLSLDPLMGRRGYPLLFAVGETADGVTQLVDRQHPHDLFMELAASYSLELGGGGSAYLYAGLPGEPALGPPTFMHRASGLDSPEASIAHHWFDSTHITFGVVTAGVAGEAWKLEASAFNGREPDEERWDIDRPRLNSWSVRGFLNPTDDLSLQASYGVLDEPEQLEPGRDERRLILSATYNYHIGADNWATTIAWARKDKRPGPVLDAFLAETSYRIADTHTFFARLDRIEQDELFEEDEPLHDQTFRINKLSAGYVYDLRVAQGVKLGIGALGSLFGYADRLEPAYGEQGAKAFMVFARLMLDD